MNETATDQCLTSVKGHCVRGSDGQGAPPARVTNRPVSGERLGRVVRALRDVSVYRQPLRQSRPQGGLESRNPFSRLPWGLGACRCVGAGFQRCVWC